MNKTNRMSESDNRVATANIVTSNGLNEAIYCRNPKCEHHGKNSFSSQGRLTQHLSSHHQCKDVYVRDGLVSYIGEVGKEVIDYSTSTIDTFYKKATPYAAVTVKDSSRKRGREEKYVDIKNEKTIQMLGVVYLKEQQCSLIPIQFLNHSLNKQVMYDATKPQLLTEIVHQMLGTHNNDVVDHVENEIDQVQIQPEMDEETVGEFSADTTTNNHINDKYKAFVERQAIGLPPGPQLASEISLLNLLLKHNMPMESFSSIMEWANTCVKTHKFDFTGNTTIRKRSTVINEVSSRLAVKSFTKIYQPLVVNWLPDNRPTPLFVKSAVDAIFTLLSNSDILREENLSFPNKTNPTIPKQYPTRSNDSPISELHHGKWWLESWKKKCEPDSNEIYVPIIFYMDGIVIDQQGTLNLSPLNITLGFFNTETRSKSDAWETIYYQPDNGYQKGLHSREPTPKESLTNLHRSLEIALNSFKDLFKSDGIDFDFLPYAGKMWKVKLKFGIAFFIGDTELHDKLCGRYSNRSSKIAMLCRHCDCPTIHAVDPLYQKHTQLFIPSDFDPSHETAHPGIFRSLSHYPIKNAFHCLDFGENPHNIHLATPGECLHMHQLGAEKRMIEAFAFLIKGNLVDNYGPVAKKKKEGSKVALDCISDLAKKYGGQMSRQSDRNFPRTKFGSSILSVTKKEGHEYAGMLLSLLVSLLSDRGREIILIERKMNAERIADQVHMIELLLGMEEWLKHGTPTHKQLTLLPTAIKDYISKVNFNCQRGGMGTRLIKNHLYFHLPKYIEMWGPPKGWNSAPSERHHKTEVKAPSKNTQKRASTISEQTARRYHEKGVIELATRYWGLHSHEEKKDHSSFTTAGGSRFTIKSINNQSVMEWNEKKYQHKRCHPKPVTDFCIVHILPLLEEKHIHGYTEQKKKIDVSKTPGKAMKPYSIFRAHPSYRSDSGQDCNVWYDWAVFDLSYEGQQEDMRPCQILCFIQTGKVRNGVNAFVGKQSIRSNHQYAVARIFQETPKTYRENYSSLVCCGQIANGLYVLDCDRIVDVCCVVHNESCTNHTSANKIAALGGECFFLISNRSEWLDYFEEEYILSFEGQEIQVEEDLLREQRDNDDDVENSDDGIQDIDDGDEDSDDVIEDIDNGEEVSDDGVEDSDDGSDDCDNSSEAIDHSGKDIDDSE